MYYDNDFLNEIEELNKNDRSDDILSSFKPIIDAIDDQMSRLHEDFEKGLEKDFVSQLCLLDARIQDCKQLLEYMLAENNKAVLDINGNNNINTKDIKVLIEKLLFKYDATDLANQLYAKFKLQNIESDESTKEIDELFSSSDDNDNDDSDVELDDIFKEEE